MSSHKPQDPNDKTQNPLHGTGNPKQGTVIQFPGNGKLSAPDNDLKQEIIRYIKTKIQTKDHKSLIAEALGEERLEELARSRSYEDLKKITDSIYESVYWLEEGKFRACTNELLEQKTLEKLYAALPYKAHQLSAGLYELCGRGEEFAAVVQEFFKAVMSNLDNRILWKPMVDELMALDGVSATLYFMGDDYLNYLQRWNEKVALLDEAIDKFGLREYARLVSGGKNVEIQEGSAFCTSSNGAIYSPAYMDIYPDRKQNLSAIRIGIVHECGHHRWKTFRMNLHPEALKLDTVGARLISERRENGKNIFTIQAKDKVIEVKTYRDIMKIVKYPKMLAFLHNVADDKRIDTLNMLNMAGLAEEYQQDIEFLLTKRADLKGTGLGDLLEGLLQQTVVGKTKGEIPEGLKEKLKKLAQDLSTMEIRDGSDGTDSLNVALRWYVTIEPELDALAARVKKKEDLDKELDKMMPNGFFGSDTSIGDNDVSVVNENPGPIVISRRKHRFGQRKPGIDPLSFLNLEGEKGDGKEEGGEEGDDSYEDGEENKEGRGNKGKNKPVGTGEAHEGNEDTNGKSYKYDEWAGTGYRKNSKQVVEHKLEGSLVRPPPYLKNQAKRMFQKYAPKTGDLVRGLDSGEPDPELQENYFEQTEAGVFTEPDYFSGVVYQRSNVVMSVNIDVSGSMDLDAGARKRIDVAIESAAVIATAASMLRWPIDLGAFTGADIVDYYLMNATKDGIIVPSSFHMNATPMAGAVRHATKRTIELRMKSHKRYAYQIWLSDAEPNCSGEGIDPVADTARAMHEARAKGIHLFGVIISDEERKKEMEEVYAKIFGGGWYVVTTSADAILRPLLNFVMRVAMVSR